MLARLFLPVQQAASNPGNVIQSKAAVSLSCHAASYIRFEPMNPELDSRNRENIIDSGIGNTALRTFRSAFVFI
jgi:hypothetical protein